MQLSCPRCGLVLAGHTTPIDYCPRCIARRRQPVPLRAEGLAPDREAAARRPERPEPPG